MIKLNAMSRAILKKRGFSSDEEMLTFLNYPEDQLRKVRDLCGGRELLDALNRSVDARKNITVYGDYDADGVMSMTILVKGLSRISDGKIRWFANNRFIDGYTITPESLARMLAQYPDTELVLTCDNGIGAAKAWEYAKERGLEVLVTDHHEQGADRILPPEIPAICEKSVLQKEADRAAGIKPEEFCGAELARRVITELYELRGIADDHQDFLDGLYAYAGVATITDVIPLNAANHRVARIAIEYIRRDRGFWHIFFDALVGGSLQLARAGSDTFGYYIGPAINAGSRLTGTVEIPMRAFLTDLSAGHWELVQAANAMRGINEERKSWAREDREIAEAEIRARGYADDAFILVDDERFREGINGLTAGDICREYQVPAIALGPSDKDPDIFKGSARSIDGIDIFEELEACADLLVTFGGHPGAAGLSVRKENIPKLRERLLASIGAKHVEPESELSAEVLTLAPQKLTFQNVISLNQAVDSLQPFGNGFEKPSMYIDTDVSYGRVFGKNYEHYSYTLSVRSADGLPIRVMFWKKAEKCEEFYRSYGRYPRLKGTVGLPEVNVWGDRASIQMNAEALEFV